MSIFLPLFVIIALSASLALLTRRWLLNGWLSALAAAALATLLWGAGCYALLWLTAPNELGPPLLSAILETFLIGLISAGAVTVAAPHVSRGPARTE